MFNLVISLLETPNFQILQPELASSFISVDVHSFIFRLFKASSFPASPSNFQSSLLMTCVREKNVEVTEKGEWVEQATQMEKSVSGCSVASTPEHHTGGATSSNKSFPAALAVCQLGGGASLCGD